MTHLIKPAPKSQRLYDLCRDYTGYMKPFVKRVSKWYHLPPFIVFKTIEYAIYRWYKPSMWIWQDQKYELIYMITSRCTDRCPKCGIWKVSEQKRILIEKVIQAIGSIRQNIEKVTVTGGEPLLYMQDLRRLCETTHDIGIPISVVTNGYLIDDEFLELVRNTQTELIVSIDTLNEKKWHQFRGRDHYQTVKRNLDKAVTIIGQYLSVQSVLADETVEDIHEVAEYCAMNGVTHYVQEYQDFGGTWHQAQQGLVGDAAGTCTAWLNICVYPNGDVVKCFDHFRIPEAKDPLGNIEEEDIFRILSSHRCIQITDLMKYCNLPCKRLRCNQKLVPNHAGVTNNRSKAILNLGL